MDYQETYQEIKKLRKNGDFEKALALTVILKKEYTDDLKLHKLINTLKIEIRHQELKSRDVFIKTGIKTIRTLRKEKQFEKAIQAGAELFDVDPDNKTAHKLLQKSKIDFIEQKLHDPIREKWLQEGKYEKLYLFYQKLKKIFPQYTRLNKLIAETEKKMIAADQIEKKAFADESLKKLRQIFSEGKYEQVIKGANELIVFTHEKSGEAKKLLTLAKKANQEEIENNTYEYMKNQQPLLKAAYKSGDDRMIKI